MALCISKRGAVTWIVAGIVMVLAVILCAVGWYYAQFSPVGDTGNTKTFVVKPGQNIDQIARNLEEQKLIRSAYAFTLYARSAGIANTLQAGSYEIADNIAMDGVAKRLTKATVKQKSITFYPGAMIFDPSEKDEKKRTDVFTMFVRAGYPESEVREALTADYDHPLFEGKPKGTSLEGYVYGDTYNINATSTVKDVLKRTFDEYYAIVQEYNLKQAAKDRGMTLYELITLASIVQREVSNTKDQAQVAQVFLTRIKKGMRLGSDVTFIYAAKQKNIPPRVDLDSPYNTRVNPGLPPGPIATPGKQALKAVANPAKGDYIFFVAGDDGKTYFTKTVAEHEAAVRAHCIKLCAEF